MVLKSKLKQMFEKENVTEVEGGGSACPVMSPQTGAAGKLRTVGSVKNCRIHSCSDGITDGPPQEDTSVRSERGMKGSARSNSDQAGDAFALTNGCSIMT